MKLTTDRYEASCGLFVTAELLVTVCCNSPEALADSACYTICAHSPHGENITSLLAAV